MRHFRKGGSILAFDEDQSHLITDDMVELTTAELNVILNPPVPVNHKLAGVEFEGVMCSATSEDSNGLYEAERWVLAGNTTVFEFENGSKLRLTKDNIADFYAVYAPFRASFFGV